MPPGRRPIVAVPARNEAERLPALMDALAAQTWCGSGERLAVVVVLNNCSDDSADVLSAAAMRHPQLEVAVQEVLLTAPDAHVGAARRLAMEAALGIANGEPCALLTTDADATPEAQWVIANLAALEAGADLVGGRIIGDPVEEARLGPGFQRRVARHLHYAELADRLADSIDPIAHDPVPRHGDHTGASLAVRGDVYAALGGMPALPFREDVAFVTRARAAGYRLRHAPEARVKVSARLVGRAPGGMADCLRAWIRAEAEDQPQLVESVDRLTARLRLRRAIRTGAVAGAPSVVASPSCAWLDGWRIDPDASQVWVELWAGDDLDTPGDTPIEHAITRIEGLLQELDAYVDAA